MLPNIGVVGSGEILAALRHLLKQSGENANCFILGSETARPLDVLVAAEASPILKNIEKNNLAAVILNSDNKDIFPLLAGSGRIITYGFNSRASITAASVTDDAILVCIQRAFKSINNQMRLPGEFSAKANGEKPANLLAAAAAFAVVGK